MKTSNLSPAIAAASASTRRRFLGGMLAVGASPVFVPATALGRDGRPAPSERITLGCLGFGTIAHTTVPSFLTDERVQVVAIADPARDLPGYGYNAELRGGREAGKALVEKSYAEERPAGTYKGCDAMEDFRQLLDRADIDAVNISTPDHWHAVMATMAARKGKHIYGQKPLCITVAEGRAMVEAIKKAGVTWQTGSQQRSDIYFRQAAEFIRNGRLGKLQEIRALLPGGHNSWSPQPKDPKAAGGMVPEGLNWDLWEGPVAHRAFSNALFPLCWRHNYDYSGGMVTDFGAHHIDIVQWALDKDETGPVKLENIKATLPPKSDLWNTATDFSFDAVYEDGTRLTVVSVKEYKDSGITFTGERDRSIFVNRGTIKTNPADLRTKEKIQASEIHLYESKHHERNFIDCIYSGKPTVAPIEAAHRTISIAHLANLAIRLGKSSVTWDPRTETSGDADINAGLSRQLRAPWSLEA